MSLLTFEESQLQLREILDGGTPLSPRQRSAIDRAIYGLGVLQLSNFDTNDVVGDLDDLVAAYSKHDGRLTGRRGLPIP
jgi:hypothetical protein